jgi:hypothetical protein
VWLYHRHFTSNHGALNSRQPYRPGKLSLGWRSVAQSSATRQCVRETISSRGNAHVFAASLLDSGHVIHFRPLVPRHRRFLTQHHVHRGTTRSLSDLASVAFSSIDVRASEAERSSSSDASHARDGTEQGQCLPSRLWTRTVRQGENWPLVCWQIFLCRKRKEVSTSSSLNLFRPGCGG